jgi:ABC-type glycerol-3-phosphate transport system permease component
VNTGRRTKFEPARTHSSVGRPDLLLPTWLSRLVVALLVLVVVLPVGYMLILSLTPDQNVALGSISIGALEVKNYIHMWSQAPLASGLFHTFVVAGGAAIASVFVAALAAYPLARFTFRGRRPFLTVLLGVQTVPSTTLVLPLFAVLSWIQTTTSLHFVGSYWPVILTYMTFGVPLSTWLLLAYIRSIPKDLEEAALVDGCTRFGAFRQVVLPIARPAIVVAFVFAFLVGWNDVLFASTFTNTSTQTLAVVVQRFANLQANVGLPLYGELMAAAVVSSVPVVVLYLAFQRYLTAGLAAGAQTGV